MATRLNASDLHDALLQSRVATAHLAEVDEWIEAEASSKGIAATSIRAPLVGRAKTAAVYQLAMIVCRANAGTNQAVMASEQDVFVAKRKMYAADLDALLPNLTAVDWSGVADESASPTISIEMERG